jgi:hypothetical protein
MVHQVRMRKRKNPPNFLEAKDSYLPNRLGVSNKKELSNLEFEVYSCVLIVLTQESIYLSLKWVQPVSPTI